MIDALVTALAGIFAGVAATLAVLRIRAARTPSAAPSRPSVPGPYEDGRTQRVLAAFPFAAFLIDAGGVVRFVNSAAEELFEISASRAVGQALIAVVPSVAMERQVLAAIEGETSMRDITIGDFAHERTLGVTVHPFEGGAVAVAADRTALLAIENVRREFVANVSHELRTPLTAIKLMLETVLISDDDAEARTLFLPQIAGEVDRMIRLVEDLLELARSEAGTLPLRREIFDLTDVATSVVNTFAQRSLAAGVELDLDAPEEVFVDSTWSTMPCGTLHPEVPLASRSGPRGELRSCGSGTPAAGYPTTTCRMFSSGSMWSTGRARASTPGPDSGFRLLATSWKRTGVP